MGKQGGQSFLRCQMPISWAAQAAARIGRPLSTHRQPSLHRRLRRCWLQHERKNVEVSLKSAAAVWRGTLRVASGLPHRHRQPCFPQALGALRAPGDARAHSPAAQQVAVFTVRMKPWNVHALVWNVNDDIELLQRQRPAGAAATAAASVSCGARTAPGLTSGRQAPPAAASDLRSARAAADAAR